MNNEYMLEIKVKNNLLLSAIRNFGIKSIAEFCRVIDCNSGVVYDFLNLKRTPFGKRGKLNPVVERICDYLGKSVFELFPKEQLENVLKVNKLEVELTSPQLQQLFYSENVDPDRLIDQKHLKEKIVQVLNTFDDMNEYRGKNYGKRIKEVLIMRFGLDGEEPKTLEEIGNIFGVTGTRIRDIEAKGLRMLRHPTRSKHLKPYLDDEFDKIASKKSAVLTEQSKPYIEYAYCLSCDHNKLYKRVYKDFEILYKCDLNLHCKCIFSGNPKDEQDGRRACINFKFKDKIEGDKNE